VEGNFQLGSSVIGHPAIKKVYCTEAGIGIFHCYIQIDERLKRPGMVNNILAAAVSVRAAA
jgi:hypothetical protein